MNEWLHADRSRDCPRAFSRLVNRCNRRLCDLIYEHGHYSVKISALTVSRGMCVITDVIDVVSLAYAAFQSDVHVTGVVCTLCVCVRQLDYSTCSPATNWFTMSAWLVYLDRYDRWTNVTAGGIPTARDVTWSLWWKAHYRWTQSDTFQRCYSAVCS